METMRSPFPHHGPLAADQVTGRAAVVVDLAQRVADRRVTALLGPRRFGKTSVLNRVASDLRESSHEVVWLDLYALTSMADLRSALVSGMSRAKGPLRKAIDTVASGLSINLGVATYDLSQLAHQDPRGTVHDLLSVLTTAAERTPTCVIFDEFAGIDAVRGGAELLRTSLQHHTQTLGLIFAGSQPSTMRMLFTDHAQPFFGQADLIELGALELPDVVSIVQEGFESTGKDAGVGPSRIVELCQGHPQRSMQVADALWRATPIGGIAETEMWEAAMADVRQSVDIGSERVFSLLTTGQQKVLRVLAVDGSIYGTAAKRTELPPATAKNAVEGLEDQGFVWRQDSKWRIVDPLLRDWIQRRF